VTVRGFADVHNHQFAHLGFGGREFFGEPEGPLAQALPWCTSVHGLGGTADPIGQMMHWMYGGGGIGHKVGGYPQFDGWPRWDSVTHQSVHESWLETAWRGGMRLMVMLAVNNEWMCSLPNFLMAPGRTGRDMEAVDLQLRAALDMQNRIDAASGGPGTGWYRIVRTPQEASAVIAAGKLAVVLGIEVDFLFNSYPGGSLTADGVRAQVQKYFDLGVRYVFPIHFGDNAFGGTALQNGMEAADVGVRITVGTISVETPFVLHTTDGRSLGYERAGGRRNRQGLTDLGRVLLTELMQRGMLFDVDHMSWQTRSDALALAEQHHYPVMSGHTGFIDLCHGDKRHEGQQTGPEVDRIRALGGIVSPIVAQGKLDEIATWTRPDGSSVPHVCGGSTNTFAQAYLYAVQRMDGANVAIGTDFNGFAGLPGPTSGPEACPGGKAGSPAVGRVSYPFTSPITGQPIGRTVVGQKTFDINDDGLAHVGMLPDFIEALRVMGVRDSELEPLLTSATAFADMWARTRQTWQAAFQANTSSLWQVVHNVGGQDYRLGMMPGTSPSVGTLPTGGCQFAFQANTGSLWVIGADNRGDLKLGMKAGTSPALVGVHGGWQAAFQANTGSLWVIGADNRGDLKLGMMPGTSPAIAAVPGGWVVAFQANTGNLWVVGKGGPGDTHLGMKAGTSPSITGLPGGGWQAAFQANTGNLWAVGTDNRGDLKLGMMDGTSPAIVAVPGGWQAAFQANTGNLWVVGLDNPGDLHLGMQKGTSPSITAVPA
jgi:microsomal dipeptidase-like Zn-dependent dipeptidase